MLSQRLKQFREYHKIEKSLLSAFLGIDEKTYNDYENGKAVPDIDIITKLSAYYKVTVDEFYGYTPRLAVHDTTSDPIVFDDDDTVSEELLKMGNLSWDEVQLVLYYREHGDKDEIIRQIIKRKFPKPESEE